MEDKQATYLMYESAQARSERINTRLWILCIILIVLLFGTNIGWIIYEMQYQDVVTVSQEVDSEDAPAYVNGTGEMTINGEGKTDSN